MIPILPKVYVVILNYKSWQDTLECLESVYSCDYPNFQVLVVDNGSKDQSLEKILAWTKGEMNLRASQSSPIFESVKTFRPEIPYRVIGEDYVLLTEGPGKTSVEPLVVLKSEQNRGYSGGNNLGIRWCRRNADFKYVWILNNDTVVQNDTLTRLVCRTEKNDWGICGSKIVYYDAPETIQALAGRFRRFAGRNGEIKDAAQLNDMDYVIGTSMLISQQCLDVGLLPEEYFLYFEEVDYCHSAAAAGIQFGVALDAVVYHKDGKSSSKELKEYYFTRNLLHFVWKKMPLMLPFSLWYVLVHRVTVKILAGQIRSIRFLLKGVGDFLRGRLGKCA